jgi:hypothetical protein
VFLCGCWPPFVMRVDRGPVSAQSPQSPAEGPMSVITKQACARIGQHVGWETAGAGARRQLASGAARTDHKKFGGKT